MSITIRRTLAAGFVSFVADPLSYTPLQRVPIGASAISPSANRLR